MAGQSHPGIDCSGARCTDCAPRARATDAVAGELRDMAECGSIVAQEIDTAAAPT